MVSRTYGGVHWRHSGPAGRDMAQRVTDYIWSHYLQRMAPIDAGINEKADAQTNTK